MPRLPAGTITKRDAALCLRLVEETAARYRIPPVHITAHVATVTACTARKEVWRVMVNEWAMPRCVVAKMFNRDLRRLRASELDNPRPNIHPRGAALPKDQRSG